MKGRHPTHFLIDLIVAKLLEVLNKRDYPVYLINLL
jgi:hypothetical protein